MASEETDQFYAGILAIDNATNAQWNKESELKKRKKQKEKRGLRNATRKISTKTSPLRRD